MRCLPRVPAARGACAYQSRTPFDRTAYGPAFGIVAITLLDSAGPGEGRVASCERIFCPAATALAVAQDAVNHAGIRNKGDNPHAAAARAQERVSLEDFPYQTSPCAAGLPRETSWSAPSPSAPLKEHSPCLSFSPSAWCFSLRVRSVWASETSSRPRRSPSGIRDKKLPCVPVGGHCKRRPHEA